MTALPQNLNMFDKTAFNDKSILLPKKLVAEFAFELDGVGKNVGIKIWEFIDPNSKSTSFEFQTSCHIKTPLQADFYVPSAYADSIDDAIKKAVDSIMGFYNQAVSKGHVPQGDWLKTNLHYR